MKGFEPVNQENFETTVLGSEKPYLVEFGATWCAPCKRLEPDLEKLAENMGSRMSMGKIDVDESPDLAVKFTVMSVPTVILFVAGEPKARITGYQPLHKLEKILEENIP